MLSFDEKQYTIKTLELDGQTLTYRAYEDIPYVAAPVAKDWQRLHIFAPEGYFHGENPGSYTKETAPIFFPNTVGGYMPGPRQQPGRDEQGKPNTIFQALCHGYVVVSPGVRGRGMKKQDGSFIGIAPAGLCDLKAAVRFLRHFAGKIPGDVEKIIANGTSAGGAMASLLGTTGDHPDYEPYLTAMGAAPESDRIFAASCYCPITNLDHADMAYEWEFGGMNEYHRVVFCPPAPGEEKPSFRPVDGVMTKEQQDLSIQLKGQFPAYLNSLGLRDDKGQPLTLHADGTGSFLDYVKQYVADCVQQELDKGRDFSTISWAVVENGTVKDIDFPQYVQYRTRMKPVPAFDNVAMDTPENELFGNEQTQFRHFTAFSQVNSTVPGEQAEEHTVKMMNPMAYVRDEKARKAPYFRIRHGAIDRDTSLAISTMLTAALRQEGIEVQLAFPWGVPHAGDYDLPDLFQWIDTICKKES